MLLLLHLESVKADCWEYAGNMFNVSPRLLLAIAQQESSLNPDAINRNVDGTLDIGLMQINSYHLPRLQTLGIDKEKLLDPCISVIVGASILADMIVRYGYSWEAVGAYNAGTSPKLHSRRMRYARKVWLNYEKLDSRSTQTAKGKGKNIHVTVSGSDNGISQHKKNGH
ncbi:type III secretion system invasion protein IagB (plasmid) [Yokenella regensburgei]|nr:type III secretion system invasion protein IagB [Yokenella regensburgei]QIU92625.1 type III secretion system invasion protein IagB [Yokenella regensburgei]